MSEQDALIVRAINDRGGAIHLDALRDLGLAKEAVWRRVDGGLLVPLQPATYGLAGAAPSWTLRARAAVAATRDGALSQRAATAWWGLEGARRSVIDVMVRRGRLPVLGGVEVHRSRDLSDLDVTILDGLAVTTVTRSLLDVGGMVHAHRLRQMADDAVRRQLTTWDAIADRLGALARRGRPGIGPMRRLLEERVGDLGRTDSHFERIVLGHLLAAGIPAPRLQHRVELPGRVAYLDMAWPDRMVALECDGWDRHGTPTALAADLDRQNALVLAGWRPIRFSWQFVRDHPGAMVGQVAAALGIRS